MDASLRVGLQERQIQTQRLVFSTLSDSSESIVERDQVCIRIAGKEPVELPFAVVDLLYGKLLGMLFATKSGNVKPTSAYFSMKVK